MNTSTTVWMSKTPIGTVNSRSPEKCSQALRFLFRAQETREPNWLAQWKIRFEHASPSSIEGCREPDGSVWGVRYFRVARPGFLVSPTSMYVWERESASADDFSNSAAVRGHIGFHAAWVEDLARWQESTVDHSECECKALVRGYGDIVLGDEGWRSSRLLIVRGELDTSGMRLRDALQRRYPRITFGESYRGNYTLRFEPFPQFAGFYSLKKLWKFIEPLELMEEYK